jgi:hypothetical protein
MNTLANLESELSHFKNVNGHAKEQYDINDNESSIVLKYIENRIKELKVKKEQK